MQARGSENRFRLKVQGRFRMQGIALKMEVWHVPKVSIVVPFLV